MNNIDKIRYKKKGNKFAGTVMFVLIFLLSVSTIITIQIRSERNKQKSDQAAASTSSSELIEKDLQEDEIPIDTNEDSVQVENEPKTDKVVFKPAVEGKILKPFSPDSLIYSETMEDWRQHMGTDIKCEYENPVSSMSDGIVADIYNDAEFGTTVVIEHLNGVITKYSNINVYDNINIGSNVNKGENLGSVYVNPLSETEDELHIHIEASKDSVIIDPMSLLN